MNFKIKTWRSEPYLKKVRENDCLVCELPPPVHAHHLRHAEKRGLSRKVSDSWTVPVCAICHGSIHERGNEQEWWALKGIDPIAWAETHCKEWRTQHEH